MGTITAIRQNKRNKSRCSVYVNDEFFAACPIDVAQALGLRKGLDMTSDLARELRQQDHKVVLRQKAYRFTTYKPRTTSQVRKALIGYGAEAQECEDVLAWLQEFNLVDDEKFAQNFLIAASTQKPLSKSDAYARLLGKGISKDIIEKYVEKHFSADVERQSALQVAHKKLAMLNGNNDSKKDKLIRFLQYRRYPWNVIQWVLTEVGLATAFVLFALPTSTIAVAQKECSKQRLSETINSFQPATQALLHPDGTLYFDRKYHPDNANGIHDPDHPWVSTQELGVWQEPKSFEVDNIKLPDIVFSFSADGRTALVVGRYGRNNKQTFALITRSSDTSLFSEVEVIEIPGLTTLGQNFYGCISHDLQTLIVAVDIEGGFGGLDLYRSTRCRTGGSSMQPTFTEWTELKNLGPTINTSAFDGAPFLVADNITLYFASSGRPDRFGKADLYVTTLNENAQWATPINLGACINSANEETSVSVVGRGDSVLFTSWDKTSMREGIYIATLDSAHRPRPTCTLRLDIVDAMTRLPVRAPSVVIRRTPSDNCKTFVTAWHRDDGEIAALLNEQFSYEIFTSAFGYTSHTQTVTVQRLDSTVELRVNVELFPTQQPLLSVYFEKGSHELSSQQQQRIDSVLALYNIRQLAFSVSGYTDAVGNDGINLSLSERRARAVQQKLAAAGVPTTRILARGNGIDSGATLGQDQPEYRRVDIFPEILKN